MNRAISTQIFKGAKLEEYKIDGKNTYKSIDTMIAENFPTLHELYSCYFWRDIQTNLILNLSKYQNNINIIAHLIREGHKIEEEQEIIRHTFFQPLFCFKRQFSKKRRINLPPNYTLSYIQKLGFLQAFLNEKIWINISNPILFTRKAKVNNKIGIYSIKKGSYINLSLVNNQLDEKYFKDRLYFYPNIWLDHSSENMINKNPFVYLPFYGGMRNRVSQHLANYKQRLLQHNSQKNPPYYPILIDLLSCFNS
ncbi:hypothetical protein ABPG74_019854 [Tetrahymena malaccensis]